MRTTTTLSAIAVFGAGALMGYAVTDQEPQEQAGMCGAAVSALWEVEDASPDELASAVNRVVEADMECQATE